MLVSPTNSELLQDKELCISIRYIAGLKKKKKTCGLNKFILCLLHASPRHTEMNKKGFKTQEIHNLPVKTHIRMQSGCHFVTVGAMS